jgi:hypothetical protein
MTNQDFLALMDKYNDKTSGLDAWNIIRDVLDLHKSMEYDHVLVCVECTNNTKLIPYPCQTVKAIFKDNHR